MKRNTVSITPVSDTTQRCTKAKGNAKVAWPTIQRCNKAIGESHELCPYFDSLPSQLTTHILLKLPIKSLLICRCVCKIWNTLISEPHFAKLQFEQAPVSLVIRTLHDMQMARSLYLLECDPQKLEFGTNHHLKLKPTFILPLRDVKLSRDKNGGKSYKEKSDEIENKFKHRYISCITNRDKFGIVNSCNGLLCLS